MRNELIDKRLEKIEQRQTEFRETIDSVLVNQGQGMKQLNEIHTFLAGTEYDNNGGLVNTVSGLKKKVQANTAWRIRITAAGTAVAGVIGFILFKFSSIIGTIKELINIE